MSLKKKNDMQRARLTKVFVSDKNRDGVEFKDKNGRKFWRMAIRTEQTGDTWHSSLYYKEEEIPQWNDGDEVTLILEKSGDFNNFRAPSRLDVLEQRVNALQIRVEKLDPPKVPGTDMNYPTSETSDGNGELTPEDIPF